MVDISRITYERNGVKTIIDNGEILWFNGTWGQSNNFCLK